ncbi:melanocortin receptor 5-like [Orbicella faveolata]|uniref:melanocortin receptor 5-like n=1 Tax=Orbicella faveolata TaxID=48498 RepID=UPI0009E4CB65|nr:melanocortin receptor 5-like [Orbicella faveolata]
MANFAAQDGNNHNTSEMNHTSTSALLTSVFVSISALNILLSITASLGNALILVALQKETSLHPPTKLLFRSLAVTDFFAGLISQPLFAVSVMTRLIRMNFHNEGYIVTGFVLCGLSVLTSTAISVDRLLALLLGLRYRHVVTLRRTRAVIFCFFATGVSCGTMHFWNKDIAWVAVIILGVVSLITSIFSYTMIYFRLQQHQAQVQDHTNKGCPNGGGIPLNVARYKKTVSSIAWVQMVLVACYLPYFIMSILRLSITSNGRLIEVLYLAAVTQIYLNSSLNPILCCWKIREVGQAAKDTIRQICPFYR